MKSWSGLAPAVDAHLERWAIIGRVVDLTDATLTGPEWQKKVEAVTAVKRVMQTDAGMRWLAFARSYGLPGPEGGPPAASFQVIDRDHEDEEGRVYSSDESGFDVRHSARIRDGSTITGREQWEHTGESLATGMLLIQREYRMLNEAVSHYVSAEVVTEVTWAAEEAFPEPLFETDLFTPAGFAVFETPIQVVDLHPDTGLVEPRLHIPIRAIGWRRHGNIMSPIDGTIGEGVSLFLYTTPTDYVDGYCRELKALTGRDAPDPADETDIEGPFIPVEVIPWRFGVEWSPRADDINYHVPGTVPTPVAFQRRWFYAFMRLCWQQIIVRHASHEPRHDHRRWERFAKRKELLDYTTLRLRRTVDPNYKPSGMGLPLEHRIKVRAHWHYAYCASMGGPARLADGTQDPTNHRWVWVESYWKGPEDGPIGRAALRHVGRTLN